jgi:hypothetical protein
MMGEPLNGVVRVQVHSAQTSVDFIKSVGFKAEDAANDPGKPSVVTFSYNKPIKTKDAT